MNNDYVQLSFKMYVCEDCESVALVFDGEVGVCDNCGGKLIEVKDEENE
jgi:rRNA maturation endonuclease Nob1